MELLPKNKLLIVKGGKFIVLDIEGLTSTAIYEHNAKID